METFELDHNLFASNKGDESLYVQFYMHYLRNEVKSQEEGRAIYDDTEFVKIFSPGDRTNIIDRPVRQSDKLRFPKQYELFKQNKEVQATGTPLTEWPIITRGMAEELKYLGFQTVEQLADASDGNVGRHMGLVGLKQKAAAYLEVAKGSTKPIEEMSKKVTDLESQVKMRDEALAAVQQRLAQLEANEASKKLPGEQANPTPAKTR